MIKVIIRIWGRGNQRRVFLESRELKSGLDWDLRREGMNKQLLLLLIDCVGW